MSRPVLAALALGAALLAPAAPLPVRAASFDQGHVHVTTSTDPKRLDFAVTVPATVDQVWDAFTTVAGVTSWLAPQATIEPRPGGKWEPFTGKEAIVVVNPQGLLDGQAVQIKKSE